MISASRSGVGCSTRIEAAPPYRVSQSSLLIAGEHNKRNALRRNRTKLRNRELPGGKYLKQHCFESVVYFVQLVNQQHARLVAFESAHQRTRPKEITPLEVRLHRLPVLVLALRELHVEPLQTLIEATNGLVLCHAAIALEPLDMGIGRGCYRDCELRLPGPRGSLKQERLFELRGQIDDLYHHRIDEVARCRQFAGEFVKRIKHRFPPSDQKDAAAMRGSVRPGRRENRCRHAAITQPPTAPRPVAV